MPDEPSANRLHNLSVAQYVVHVVLWPAASCENCDRAVDVLADIPCILERFPRAFEEEPVLRVENCRITRAHPEKRRVEARDIVEAAARFDICRILQAVRRLPSRQ